MSILEQIATGVAVGIGVEHGKRATDTGARRASEVAGTAEREASMIEGPAPAPLWSKTNPHLAELATIDRGQAALVGALLHEHRSELADLVDAIKSIVPSSFAEPFWFAAGDTVVQRNVPPLPTGGGPWRLEGFTAWTDPAAAADATLLVEATGLLQIPLRIVATRNNPASIAIGLPITRDVSFRITPAPGGGGAVTDRVVLLARFTRNV